MSADAAARHAGAGRRAERQRARAGLHQERIGVAVIAAFELDDPVAAGGRARDAHARSSPLRCPELTKRTRSSDGISARTRSPSSTSSGLGAPKLVPCLRRGGRAPSPARAARGRGSAVPTTSRSRCSGCRRRPRCARPTRARMKSGEPPTALKARTGLSTPPGRIREAPRTGAPTPVARVLRDIPKR